MALGVFIFPLAVEHNSSQSLPIHSPWNMVSSAISILALHFDIGRECVKAEKTWRVCVYFLFL